MLEGVRFACVTAHNTWCGLVWIYVGICGSTMLVPFVLVQVPTAVDSAGYGFSVVEVGNMWEQKVGSLLSLCAVLHHTLHSKYVMVASHTWY
jgi:hypothetical protein